MKFKYGSKEISGMKWVKLSVFMMVLKLEIKWIENFFENVFILLPSPFLTAKD